MAELLRNAWMGWFRLTGAGKLMALFLVSVLFLRIGYKQEKQRVLLRYSTVAAVCCIVPVTAAALMLYQTRFYDYEWIWSIVPVTIVTAYGGTRVLAEYWQGFRREAWRKGLPVTAGLLLVACLCGSAGNAGTDRDTERAWREQAENVLKVFGSGRYGVPEGAGGKENEICMWAPRKIMEYVRRMDSSILLPYGRDMWEEALGAYSYDSYSEEMESLYRWMCIVEETRTESDFDFTEIVIAKMEEQGLSTGGCLDAAKQAGVNILILPENINPVLLNEVIYFTGTQPALDSGYFYFQL